MSDNITTDANGAAHNGTGLAKGGGQYTSPLTAEQPNISILHRGSALTVPARPIPAGNSESARTQRLQLAKEATAFTREMMRQNPEFLALIRSASEDVLASGASSYPEVSILTHEETEDEAAFAELRCPWCGAESSGEDSFHDIGVAERWDKVAEFSDDGTSIVFDTDGDADFESLHIACSSCDNPVSLPEGVDVDYS